MKRTFCDFCGNEIRLDTQPPPDTFANFFIWPDRRGHGVIVTLHLASQPDRFVDVCSTCMKLKVVPAILKRVGMSEQ